MRRDAKASSGGSTSGAGFGLGRNGLAAVAVLFSFLLVPAFASAAEHDFLETFGSAAQPTFGEFAATGMAVDQSSGDVLVIDTEAGTLSRYHEDGIASNFSALGTNVITGFSFTFFAGQVQVAVDNSGGETDGNIYVAEGSGGGIKIFDQDGNSLGELTASSEGPFTNACGVAVDPSGNVYVGDEAGEIHKYAPSGAAPVNADSSANFPFSAACTLAAGAGPTAGFIFAIHFFGSTAKLDATTGAEEYELDPGSSFEDSTVSVDPFNGHVLIAASEVIKEFKASSASGATEVSNTAVHHFARGVAVSKATGNVYVTGNENPNVDVFSPLPPVSVKLAIDSSGGNSSGQVNCEVNDGESIDEPCAAEYIEGTELKLIPDPDANTEFGGFEGGTGSASACSTAPCTFAIGEDSSVEAGFDFEASLIAITGLTPDKGLSEGGTSVEIKGQNFTGAESVKFGASSATFSVESPTLIKATAPAGAIGKVRVIVKTPGGESIDTAADDFSYVPSPPTVSAISPTKGPTAGGIAVTITGTNLENATSVKFGATEATITEDTATQIKVTAPACAEGTLHVTVTTAGGTSTTTAADEYTCVAAPAVSAISPSKGPSAGGTAVTITGTNLAEATSVKFGASEATITEDTATQIKVTAPSCLAGALHVTVTTAGGTSATSAADEFTCVAAPSITSISPAKGADEGGNQIEISGLNLSAASEVEFGTTVVKSPFLSNSATKLKVKVPAHTAGKVDVRVTTIGGTSPVVAADEYTFVAPPALVINKAGSGSGSVSCDGGACKASYVFGAKVALSATADPGSTFAGFSGSGCSGATCALSLEADTTVTATFNANPPSTGGGGGSTPPPPATTPTPAPKPLKCKKGFKKKKVHGKAKCVKQKKRHKRSAKHNRAGAR